MIYRKVTELMGNTPILELPLDSSGAALLLKIEKNNPGGSMKDRMARNMVLAALEDGRLRRGGTIIESSSGNTGIGLAITAAELGLRFIAIVDHHAAADKLAVMKALGAELRFVEGDYAEDEVAVVERQNTAERLSREIPGALFMNQSDNSANPAGYKGLVDELFDQTDGKIDYVVGCTGTGGSLSGMAREMKARDSSIVSYGVEPKGSIIFGVPGHPYYQSGTGTPKGDEIGKILDYSVIDEGFQVGDSEAFETARFLARETGLLVGGSTGGAVYKALELINERDLQGTVVCCVADGGEKYLHTVFNQDWLRRRNLLDSAVWHRLAHWLHIEHPYAATDEPAEKIA